jgi:hypothetical protein
VAAKAFEFRGSKRRPEDVKSLLRVLEAELEEDSRRLRQFDQEVFLAHYQMALAVAPNAVHELTARYAFHASVQGVLLTTKDELARLSAMFQALSGRELSEADIRQVVSHLRQSRAALIAAVDEAANVPVPALPQTPPGLPLGHFIRPENVLPELYSETAMPDVSWVRSLKSQLDEVHDKSQRIHYASLAEILALQEKIAGAWRSAAARSRAG